MQEYKDALDIEEKINGLIRDYGKKISELAAYIKSWIWDDPVSSIYNQLFNAGVILDLQFDSEKMKEDLERRYKHKIPPGYKDGSKPDAGIGDLLIWYTILEIAKTRNSHVVFVSSDEKPDWFYQSMRQSLYPRFELVTEFFRESSGKSFHIVKLSELLSMQGVDSRIVEEIEGVQDSSRWIDEIVSAFEALEGKARLSEVYEYIKNTTSRTLAKTWEATVRYTIQIHSSDAEAYRGGPDLFRRLGRGYWALRGYVDEEDDSRIKHNELG